MSPKKGIFLFYLKTYKIRCDATSEANVEQCSSCKRAGVNCSFSRVPMKRGPTKGLEAQYDHIIRCANIRYIRELEDRLVSLEYSVQTKAHVAGRERSPAPPAPPPPPPPPSLPRRHAEYSSGGTLPQVFNKPHTHPNESVKLNPVLISHSRSHDRLPPIEVIHASPSMNTEKRHSTDYFRPPNYPHGHRHEPLPSHSFHQNQHDHTPPDRRESIDQSQRKMSFPTLQVHERPSPFNDAVGRRPSNLSLYENKPAPIPGALPIDDAALNRFTR
jgi:Fungal Zn(2)-Cys(6) binuclear cluster domain